MEKVSVSVLRENLSMFLNKVQNGQTIIISSRGHNLAKLMPIEEKMESSRETLRKIGKNAHIGDILSPVDEEWEAMK